MRLALFDFIDASADFLPSVGGERGTYNLDYVTSQERTDAATFVK